MVKFNQILLCSVCALVCLSAKANFSYAEDNEPITRFIKADACDDRQLTDDKQTAENRAVDKASIAAVKLSGIIQKYYPNLTASALDIISYRIIDDYMLDVNHRVTISDDSHVCVNVSATVEIMPEDLDKLIVEYRNSEATEFQAAEIADEVNENTSFKADTLQDKRLIYIENMSMWNGETTNHYYDYLSGLFSHSDYFYVTDAQNAQEFADYVISPSLSYAKVERIDKQHHKMQMVVEIAVTSPHDSDFAGLGVKQNHFILFAADKNEQEIADVLIRKLIKRASGEITEKLNNYLSEKIEMESRGTKN